MMTATVDGGFLWRFFGVRIRNRLIREGRFLSENKNDWYGEYAFMIWLDFVALCRLSGHNGELPRSLVGSGR